MRIAQSQLILESVKDLQSSIQIMQAHLQDYANALQLYEEKVTKVEEFMIKHVSYHDTIDKSRNQSFRVMDLVQATLILILMFLQYL